MNSGQACRSCRGSCSPIPGRGCFGHLPGDKIAVSPPSPIVEALPPALPVPPSSRRCCRLIHAPRSRTPVRRRWKEQYSGRPRARPLRRRHRRPENVSSARLMDFLSRCCSVFGVRQLAAAVGRRSQFVIPARHPWTLIRVLVTIRRRLPALAAPQRAPSCAAAAALSVAMLLSPPCQLRDYVVASACRRCYCALQMPRSGHRLPGPRASRAATIRSCGWRFRRC